MSDGSVCVEEQENLSAGLLEGCNAWEHPASLFFCILVTSQYVLEEFDLRTSESQIRRSQNPSPPPPHSFGFRLKTCSEAFRAGFLYPGLSGRPASAHTKWRQM